MSLAKSTKWNGIWADVMRVVEPYPILASCAHRVFCFYFGLLFFELGHVNEVCRTTTPLCPLKIRFPDESKLDVAGNID